MKKFALTLASISIGLTANAITIFDDFGAGNTYYQIDGWTLVTAGGGPANVAAQFVAGGTGLLTTVDLGVTYIQQGAVSAFLYADAGGTPDNTNQIFLGTGTPTGQFLTTDNNVLSLSVGGTVPVTMGTTYWLVLKIANSSFEWDLWNFNTVGARGPVDYSIDHSNWNSFGSNTFFPAFRLTASGPSGNGNGVPDSGGTLAMLGGSVALLFAFHRVKDSVSRGWAA
jgi:hypothetical protein